MVNVLGAELASLRVAVCKPVEVPGFRISEGLVDVVHFAMNDHEDLARDLYGVNADEWHSAPWFQTAAGLKQPPSLTASEAVCSGE
jgi:hypothetical protein